MRFWDASAVVPLVIAEAETPICRALLLEDPEIVVWCLTPVEVMSALARRLREDVLRLPEFRRAKAQLGLLERSWAEVTSVEQVRELARRLLETHALRAAGALQLASALIVAEHHPRDFPFVTLGQRLSDAAEREGFALLGPDA